MSKKLKKSVLQCVKETEELSDRIKTIVKKEIIDEKKILNYSKQLDYFRDNAIATQGNFISLDKFLIVALYAGYICLFNFKFVNRVNIFDNGPFFETLIFVLAIFGCIFVFISTISLWLNLKYAYDCGSLDVKYIIIDERQIYHDQTERSQIEKKRKRLLTKMKITSRITNSMIWTSITIFIFTLSVAVILPKDSISKNSKNLCSCNQIEILTEDGKLLCLKYMALNESQHKMAIHIKPISPPLSRKIAPTIKYTICEE